MQGRESIYAYRATRQDGGIVRGEVLAVSREAAAETLTHSGLWALELRARDDAASFRTSRRRFPIAELALGLRVLAELLEAGLPVSRALIAFEELASPAWRHVLAGMRESVRVG